MIQSLFSFSNPAPTVAGLIAMICGTALMLLGTGEQAALQGIGLIGVGIGLATARQNNVSSEMAGAKPKE